MSARKFYDDEQARHADLYAIAVGDAAERPKGVRLIDDLLTHLAKMAGTPKPQWQVNPRSRIYSWCHPPLGRSAPARIEFNRGFTLGTVVHEMGHAVVFCHVGYHRHGKAMALEVDRLAVHTRARYFDLKALQLLLTLPLAA